MQWTPAKASRIIGAIRRLTRRSDLERRPAKKTKHMVGRRRNASHASWAMTHEMHLRRAVESSKCIIVVLIPVPERTVRDNAPIPFIFMFNANWLLINDTINYTLLAVCSVVEGLVSAGATDSSSRAQVLLGDIAGENEWTVKYVSSFSDEWFQHLLCDLFRVDRAIWMSHTHWWPNNCPTATA